MVASTLGHGAAPEEHLEQGPSNNHHHHGDDDGRSSSLGRERWAAYQEACGPLDFDLYLSIGVHMSLYAQPVAPAAVRECRPLMLHADASHTPGKAKDVREVEDEDLPPEFFEDRLLPLGNFQFQDIADSFNAIDADAPGETEYYIVTNNCAVLILGMMRALGIQLSPQERVTVVNGLVKADAAANHKLAQYVRDSGVIEGTLGLTSDATNEQLLERLTLRQIAEVLDAEPPSSRGPGRSTDVERRRMRQSGEGERNRDLVVGGTPVTTQKYPFLVYSEEVSGLPVCGGVLVAPDVVLTTAGPCYGTCHLEPLHQQSLV